MTEPERTYRTKSGRKLTNADLDRLAEEAERGYDVSHLIKRNRRRRMTKALYAALPFLMLAAAVVLIVVALVTSQLYWLAGAGLLVAAAVLHVLNERRDRDG